MTNYENGYSLIKLWLQDCVVDGIDFWGPKLILGESPNVEERVIILLEGAFTLLESSDSYPCSPPVLNEWERLAILFELRRKRIKQIQLIEETLDLVLIFEDGKQLFIFGDFGELEAWEVKLDNTDYSAVIACPTKELAVWGPKEKESSHIVVQFQFYSDTKEFNLNEFSEHFIINERTSWSLGDPWFDGERLWSVTTVKRILTKDYHLAHFLKELEDKKEEIEFLKNKYEAKVTMELITNIFDNHLPFVQLTSKQLQFLASIQAELSSYFYNYKG